MKTLQNVWEYTTMDMTHFIIGPRYQEKYAALAELIKQGELAEALRTLEEMSRELDIVKDDAIVDD